MVAEDFQRLRVAVVAVEVDASALCAGFFHEPSGIEIGNMVHVDSRRCRAAQQVEERERAGNLVTMNAGGKIERGRPGPFW